VREGKAKVVTGNIATVTENGITMKGGERVDVDIIITATGLTLQPNFPMSTMEVTIDGKP
jgi:monooxygenase